jgi:branched-chain amino acid transport system substrate-binding protein
VDTPKNRDFVKRFHAMHGVYPDMFDGETYEGLEWLTQIFQKAGTADDVEKVIEAWEDSSYEGLEGPFLMRKCDHQAIQPGFMVEAVKDPNYPHLIPKILATYPGDRVTPKCRSEDFA